MPRYKEPFSLYPRKTKKNIIVWYYRTYNEKGRRTIGRSTGESSKTLARQYCQKLISKNKLIPQKSPTLAEWAEKRRWWIWGECLYIKGRLARSSADRPAITRRYADLNYRVLEQRILSEHGDKRLDTITPEDCEKLLFYWADQGFTHKTVNNWASAYRVMLGEAARIDIIERNPWEKVLSLVPNSKRRGLLTMAEARQLLNPATYEKVWDGHHMYYCINLVAALTAMRQGEILALRRGNVFSDHLHVKHSWATKYGQGKTKTKEIADVPIPGFLYREMEKYLKGKGYIFSFSDGRRPATGNRVTEWLYRAMRNIGISEHERAERNLTFHSWRHFFNTYLRSRGVPDSKIKAVTRHKTQEMTEHYT
ncbi:hypothetical protein LCGC14_2393170, partial [marine sediment metagenome]